MDSFILESCGLDPKPVASFETEIHTTLLLKIFRYFPTPLAGKLPSNQELILHLGRSCPSWLGFKPQKVRWSTQHPRRDSFPVELLVFLQYVLLLCTSQVSRFRELRGKFGNGRTLKKSLSISLPCIVC